MSSQISKVWTFRSDSNPSKSYETLLYKDGTTSCGCPGWTRRVAANGERSCKHTRLVDQGIADSHCDSSHEYTQVTVNVTVSVPTNKVTQARPGQRKLVL